MAYGVRRRLPQEPLAALPSPGTSTSPGPGKGAGCTTVDESSIMAPPAHDGARSGGGRRRKGAVWQKVSTRRQKGWGQEPAIELLLASMQPGRKGGRVRAQPERGAPVSGLWVPRSPIQDRKVRKPERLWGIGLPLPRPQSVEALRRPVGSEAIRDEYFEALAYSTYGALSKVRPQSAGAPLHSTESNESLVRALGRPASIEELAEQGWSPRGGTRRGQRNVANAQSLSPAPLRRGRGRRRGRKRRDGNEDWGFWSSSSLSPSPAHSKSRSPSVSISPPPRFDHISSALFPLRRAMRRALMSPSGSRGRLLAPEVGMMSVGVELPRDTWSAQGRERKRLHEWHLQQNLYGAADPYDVEENTRVAALLAVAAGTLAPEEAVAALDDARRATKQALHDELIVREEAKEGYKAMRLRAVLEDADIEMELGMAAELLSEQRSATQVSESALHEEQLRRVELNWAVLPMRFLYERPGGAALCRGRLTQALTAWGKHMVRSHLEVAVGLWKIMCEGQRFTERGLSYRALFGATKIKEVIRRRRPIALKRRLKRWRAVVCLMIFEARSRAARVIQTAHRRHLSYRAFLRMHYTRPLGGPLSDIYLAPQRSGLPFYINHRVRSDRRQLWGAAVILQKGWRSAHERRGYLCLRAATIHLQASVRSWSGRRAFAHKRSQAMILQGFARMIPWKVGWRLLRPIPVVMQRCIRGFLGRLHAKRIRLARVKCAERTHSSLVISIQTAWRAHIARILLRELREDKERLWYAALLVQRAWYRRMGNFSTFVLVGCLRELDKEDHDLQRVAMSWNLHYRARKIQRIFRKRLCRRKESAAALLQSWWRSCLGLDFCAKLRRERWASRKLRWWLRGGMKRRHNAARKIAFLWLHASPSRLLLHLRALRVRWAIAYWKRSAEERNTAAEAIQAVVHGVWTRRMLRRESAARTIQRAFRAHATRQWVRSALARAVSELTTTFVSMSFATARSTVTVKRMEYLSSKALRIQSTWRAYRSRLRLSYLKEVMLTEVTMAKRLQSAWRSYCCVKYEMLSAIRRARMLRVRNFFVGREVPNMVDICVATLTVACTSYSPFNPLASTTLWGLCRALGCDADALPILRSSGISSLASIKKLGRQALARILPDEGIWKAAECRKNIDSILTSDVCGRLPESTSALLQVACRSDYRREFAEVFGRSQDIRADGLHDQLSTCALPPTVLGLRRFLERSETPGQAKASVAAFANPPAKELQDMHTCNQLRLHIATLRLADAAEALRALCSEDFSLYLRIDGLVDETDQLCMRRRFILSRGGWMSSSEERLAFANLVNHFACTFQWLSRLSSSASVVQRAWRGAHARDVVATLRHTLAVARITEEYLRWRQDNHVLAEWHKAKEEEEIARAKEAERARKAAERLEINSMLEASGLLQFGWKGEWDSKGLRVYNRYRRVRVKTKRDSAEIKAPSKTKDESIEEKEVHCEGPIPESQRSKALFRYEHEMASRVICRTMRAFMARHILKVLSRKRKRQETEKAERLAWEERRWAADRHITVSLRAEQAPQAAGRLRPSCLTRFDASLLHREDNKTRMGFAVGSTRICLRISYTRAATRFGFIFDHILKAWTCTFNPDVQLKDRPLYDFEEEVAAKQIQTLFRMAQGRRNFKKQLASQCPAEMTRSAILQGAALAWTGYELEGLLPAMWLLRAGCPPEVATVLAKAHQSLASLFTMLLPATEITGITRPELKKLQVLSKLSQQGSLPRELALLNYFSGPEDSRSLEQAIADGMPQIEALIMNAYPNSHGRVAALASRVAASSYPVSSAQIEAWLGRYPGKPGQAQSFMAQEILASKTVPEYAAQREAYHIFVATSMRLSVVLSNMRLQTLRILVEEATSSAFSLVSAGEMIGIGCDAHVKAALLIRLRAFQPVLIWESGATKVQAMWRGHALRKKIARQERRRHKAAIRLQCAFRTRMACASAARLRRQMNARWQQLWNEEADAFYYYDMQTCQSQWLPPQEIFRPMVRDRISKSLLLAWPGLEHDAAAALAPEGTCMVCRDAPATQKCALCSPPRMQTWGGGHLAVCFACFADWHTSRPAISHHHIIPMTTSRPAVLQCSACGELATRCCLGTQFPPRVFHALSQQVELSKSGSRVPHATELLLFLRNKCKLRFSKVRCEALHSACVQAESATAFWQAIQENFKNGQADCDDVLCGDCWTSLHRKGSRRNHRWIGFAAGSHPCIRCTRRAAERLCEMCGDEKLCEPCFKDMHARGKRLKHSYTRIVEEGEGEICHDCHRRLTSSACELCHNVLCDSCALFTHHRKCKKVERRKSEATDASDDDDGDAGWQCCVCESEAIHKCASCGDIYCGSDACFASNHARGARAKHERVGYLSDLTAARTLKERKREKKRARLQAEKEKDLKRIELEKRKEKVKMLLEARRVQREQEVLAAAQEEVRQRKMQQHKSLFGILMSSLRGGKK